MWVVLGYEHSMGPSFYFPGLCAMCHCASICSCIDSGHDEPELHDLRIVIRHICSSTDEWLSIVSEHKNGVLCSSIAF